MLPKLKLRQLFRYLDPENLRGAAQYYDAQATYAERLCLENILSAQAEGATVLNYVEVKKLERQGNKITHLVCKDRFSEQEFSIQGSERTVVINTSGPWVDQVCKRGFAEGSEAPIGKRKKIGGTKGSHIVVGAFAGAPETALYVEAKTDGRPFFIVPWLGMYLIGTTDLPFQGELDNIKADNDEIDYLLTETNNIIPTAQLSREDIKFTYSGVRPLPNEEGKKPGSVTRKHILHDHSKEGVVNLISLIGGKLTTYRHVGQEMVDAVFKKLGRQAPPCPTEQAPLPGYILPTDPRLQKARDQYSPLVPLKTIHHLFSLYGAKALEVLELAESEPELAELITPELPDIKAQIVYAIRFELAHTLLDITRRRTTLAMEAHYGLELLPVITDTLKKHCGWSDQKCSQQVADYYDYMKKNCIPDYALTPLESSVEPQLISK